NIVITRDDELDLRGAVRARSLPEALELAASVAGPGTTTWVIGGGAIYADAIDVAEQLVVTEIDLAVDGDTLAPRIPEGFALAGADPAGAWRAGAGGLRDLILTYRRAPHQPGASAPAPGPRPPRPAPPLTHANFLSLA